MSHLERRLARIEEQADPGTKMIIIDCWSGETSEEGQRRHFAEHPEDKDATTIICWLWGESDPVQRRAMQQRMLESRRT